MTPDQRQKAKLQRRAKRAEKSETKSPPPKKSTKPISLYVRVCGPPWDGMGERPICPCGCGNLVKTAEERQILIDRLSQAAENVIIRRKDGSIDVLKGF